jgi:hypothetical protein
MASRKNFTPGKGKYYFTVRSAPNNITMYRKTRKEAIEIYQHYKKVGKDIEWLGKWDGKKFVESTPPQASAA